MVLTAMKNIERKPKKNKRKLPDSCSETVLKKCRVCLPSDAKNLVTTVEKVRRSTTKTFADAARDDLVVENFGRNITIQCASICK